MFWNLLECVTSSHSIFLISPLTLISHNLNHHSTHLWQPHKDVFQLPQLFYHCALSLAPCLQFDSVIIILFACLHVLQHVCLEETNAHNYDVKWLFFLAKLNFIERLPSVSFFCYCMLSSFPICNTEMCPQNSWWSDHLRLAISMQTWQHANKTANDTVCLNENTILYSSMVHNLEEINSLDIYASYKSWIWHIMV